MTVYRVIHQENFVTISKKPLEDPELSFKAKGLWAYCMSRPNHWQFHISHLATVSKDGEDAIYSAIKELEISGYVQKIQNNEGGRFSRVDYVFKESKEIYIPSGDFSQEHTIGMKNLLPQRDFPRPENPPLVNTYNKQIYIPPLVPRGIPLPKKEEKEKKEENEEDFRITKEEEEYVMQKLRERAKSLPKITNWKAWQATVIKNYREEKERDRDVKSNEEKHKAQALAYDSKRINGDLVSVCRDRVEFTSGSFFKAVPFALSPESWTEQTRRWFQDEQEGGKDRLS